MYPSFQNKNYVIKVIIIYVLERKITDLKIRGVVSQLAFRRRANVGPTYVITLGQHHFVHRPNVGPTLAKNYIGPTCNAISV